jgi:hypothetical protein
MSLLQKILGTDGATQLAVDPYTHGARTSPRPIDVSSGGAYRHAIRSGTIAATLAANGIIYAFRWGDSSLNCVVQRIRAQLFANIAFTGAFNDMSMYAKVGRAYTASHTGQTAAVLTGNNAKLRTDFPTSKIATNGDIRIANTAVLGGGTVTEDTDPFVYSQVGKPNVVNVAAGTEYLSAQPLVTLDYEPDMGDGVHPLLLEQNEGFIIHNGPVVWPAAGSGVLVVQVQWAEVLAAAL